MSGLEVIGSISAIITILDASIKIYDNTRNDMKLPEVFESVRRQLPVILQILQTCENNLEPSKDSMPLDVCEALEKILDACDEKARKLREIFEMVIPGEKDTWEKRYAKVIRRFGKGNKVEELMTTLTQDVQLIVNHHAVNSATLDQNSALKNILQEMQSVQSSTTAEEHSALTFHSAGGAQTNNVNSGGGQQINNNAHVGTQYFQSVTVKQRADFSFRGPIGFLLGQAPYIASELFVGRGYELDEIAKKLHPDHKAQKQRRLVLGGMGGIGKTQLAIAYAESGRGSYSSVFWLNAVSEAALKDSFRSTASHIFDGQEPAVLEDKEIIRRVHQWLSTPENTGWLLIFDNYDDPGQFQVDHYYPPASHGTILVTTRRPDLVAGSTFDIKSFQNIEDSLAILQTRSNRENVQSDPHAKRLAKRLAGLPLALATAGTYLQRRTFTFERYLEEYEKRWNLDPRRPLVLQEYQERTIYTTWDLSYCRLEMEDPDAAKILKLLAYFDNQSLWYELFHAGLTDSSPEWLREVITDDVNFNGVMGVLAEYYFLDTHQTSESWSMHNCVHDWTLAVLNKDIDAKHYWYAFDCISASINDDNADNFAKLSYSPLAAHATRLVQQRLCKNDAIYNIASCRLNQASLIANLLRDQVLLLAAEQMYQRALAGKEKALGADHTSTLDTVDNFGVLYRVQGKLDHAEQMYQRSLAGKEKALGADHISTLETINSLGILYRAQGKLDQAEQMYQRALAGRKKALGADHMSTLNTVNNLGSLYWNQGKLDQAEQMYQQALAGKEKALGADHTSTLNTVNNLGGLYWYQGKLDQAEQIYQRALAGRKKALGADHTLTLETIDNLGVLYRHQCKLDQAEQMHQRALAGFEKALGADHRSTLNAGNNLGVLYCGQGKLDQAEQMYQRALAGFEKALGADHTSTLNSVDNLGVVYRVQGRLDQAEQMHQRALAGREKALGADHTLTLETIDNLGVLYRHQGKLDLAEQMHQQALAGREKAFGADHTLTLETIDNLGVLYRMQGKLDQAEQMHQRALAGKEKALGADHTSTLEAVNNLGILYRHQGKLDQAEQLQKAGGARE
ncbi:TPR repeat protein [Penicillium capsulatum]|uniref:TPR repeat protein n=1 Tax=Penicillium capsulatum TaxID=69766 RepID=A0A9W9ISH9_9EURO|nr:TPR repeat protein [Penicillium capsulatum]KAJ6130099.1 TPR repeat protein [Penicillium capsulatum]